MAFSEKIKIEVKRKAAFRCCRCQSISVQVHHIIPEHINGPDTIENAAPLCPNCHSNFGDNPLKRKEITQIRDWWYERVEVMYPSRSEPSYLEEIYKKIEALSVGQEKTLVDLKNILKKAAITSIENITLGTAVSTASGIAQVIDFSSSPSPSPSPEDDTCGYCLNGTADVGIICPRCGRRINR